LEAMYMGREEVTGEANRTVQDKRLRESSKVTDGILIATRTIREGMAGLMKSPFGQAAVLGGVVFNAVAAGVVVGMGKGKLMDVITSKLAGMSNAMGSGKSGAMMKGGVIAMLGYGLFEGVKAGIDAEGDVFVKVLTGLKEGVSAATFGVSDDIANMISETIGSENIKTFSQIFASLIDNFIKIPETVMGWAEYFTKNIGPLTENIVGFLGHLASGLFNFLGDIGKGAIGWVGDALGDLGNSVIAGIAMGSGGEMVGYATDTGATSAGPGPLTNSVAIANAENMEAASPKTPRLTAIDASLKREQTELDAVIKRKREDAMNADAAATEKNTEVVEAIGEQTEVLKKVNVVLDDIKKAEAPKQSVLGASSTVNTLQQNNKMGS